MTDEQQRRPVLELEIIIGEDGEVVFPDLNADLLDVALALDPDSDLSCRRAPEPEAPDPTPMNPKAGDTK